VVGRDQKNQNLTTDEHGFKKSAVELFFIRVNQRYPCNRWQGLFFVQINPDFFQKNERLLGLSPRPGTRVIIYLFSTCISGQPLPHPLVQSLMKD